MIISCSTYGHRFLSLEGALNRIAKLGFKAVDIMATRPHLLPTDFDSEDVKRIRSLIQSLDLEVSAITAFDGHPHWHLSAANKKHREDTVNHVKSCIDLADALGSKVVQAITGMPLIQDISFVKAWKYAKESLRECAVYAKKHNIYVALEGEENNVVRTSQDTRRMIEEVNHSNLKALLEVGHANMMATDDPTCAVETLESDIVHCHVHDNNGASDEHGVPGDGTVYWEGVLRNLAEVDYEGYLALELLVPNPDGGAMKGKEYLEFFLKR